MKILSLSPAFTTDRVEQTRDPNGTGLYVYSPREPDEAFRPNFK